MKDTYQVIERAPLEEEHHTQAPLVRSSADINIADANAIVWEVAHQRAASLPNILAIIAHRNHGANGAPFVLNTGSCVT